MLITRKMAVALSILVLPVGYSGVAEAGLYDAAVLADNPFLYYRFEEGGGSTAIDTAGGDQNGSYLDDVALFDQPLTGDDLAKLIDEGPAGFLAVIPEPSTFTLAILGLLGLALFGRRRRTG